MLDVLNFFGVQQIQNLQAEAYGMACAAPGDYASAAYCAASYKLSALALRELLEAVEACELYAFERIQLAKYKPGSCTNRGKRSPAA